MSEKVNGTPGRLSFVLPSLLLFLFLLAYLWRDTWMLFLITGFPDEIRAAYILNRTLLLAVWVTGTWAFLSAFSSLVVRPFERRRGRQLPLLLLMLFRFTVILLATVIVLVAVFDMSPMTVGLLFAGGVVLGVLFLRNIFTELLAGLSISLDSQLGTGSRIALPDGTRGTIRELNWRSVVLLLDDGGVAVIPNTRLSGDIVRNLDSHGDRRPVHFLLTLDFSLPVDRGCRVLTAAVTGAAQEPGIVSEPPPRAYASGPGSFGIEYAVEFEYHAGTLDEGAARSAVIRHIMLHLKETGLSLSLPKQNVFVGEARMMARKWEETVDREALISNIDLFRSLEAGEIHKLASETVIREVRGGQEIIREGDTSTAMFGLAEGLLEVSVASNTSELVVAVVEPGSFFGEMSMLADEPRSATVTALVDSLVFEIRRESFRDILQNRGEVAESISRLIAARQLSNNEKLKLATDRERTEALSSASSNLLDRIRSVFSLFGKPGEKTGSGD